MRRPELCVFGLLLLSSLLFSFAVEDYLYSGEKVSDITKIPLSYQANNYTLVKITGVETFLLDSSGSPVTDTGAISPVIKNYYQAQFYPSSSDLSASLEGIRTFNKSRDSRTRYGNAESVCKQGLGLGLRTCTNTFECTQTATIVCTLYGASGCDVGTLAPLILDFSLGTASLDADMVSVEADYSSMNSDNLDSKLEDVQSRIASMKTTATNLKKSDLRFPDTGDICPNCLGVCPSMPYDLASLDSANSNITAIRDQIKPLSTLGSVPQQISDRTTERLNYKNNIVLADTLSAKFNAVQNTKANITFRALQAQLLVNDPSFESDVSSLVKKAKDIQDAINSKNFASVNSSIDDYEALANRIDAELANFTKPYDTTKNAQDNATSMLLNAEWRLDRTNKQEVNDFNSLRARQYQLDSKFTPPMSASDYSILTRNYTKLSADTAKMINTYGGGSSSFFQIARPIGKNSVDGVMSLAANIQPISYKTRQQYAPLVLPVLLGLSDFSFVSLAIAIFIGVVIGFKRFFTKKVILAGWTFVLVAFVALLLVGSVAFYFVLDSASNSANFSDFFLEVKASNTTAVVIDNTNAPASAMTSLDDCAGNVSENLGAIQKAVRLYEITGASCTVNGKTTNKTADACLAGLNDVPIIYLKYSAKNETPKFYVVYQREALVSGDAGYLDRCDIAKVLR